MTKQEEIEEVTRLLYEGACIYQDGGYPCPEPKDCPVCYLDYLHDSGVVIKVGRELPKPPQEPLIKIGDSTGWGRFRTGSPKEIWKMACKAFKEAGFTSAIEPLIKEV